MTLHENFQCPRAGTGRFTKRSRAPASRSLSRSRFAVEPVPPGAAGSLETSMLV